MSIFKVARARTQSQLECVGINPQLKIHMILFKVTVKRSMLQMGIKILKVKGGCTRIIVLWMVCLVHNTVIHVQQLFNF